MRWESLLTHHTGSTGNEDSLVLVGMLVRALLSLAAGIWLVRGQLRYIRLFSSMNGEKLPLPQGYLRRPYRSLEAQNRGSWDLFKLIWQRQTQSELEAMRRQVVRRFWLTMAAVWLGVLIPLIAPYLQ